MQHTVLTKKGVSDGGTNVNTQRCRRGRMACSLSVVWPKPEAPSSIFQLKAKLKRRLGGKESEVVTNIVEVCLRQWSSEVEIGANDDISGVLSVR